MVNETKLAIATVYKLRVFEQWGTCAHDACAAQVVDSDNIPRGFAAAPTVRLAIILATEHMMNSEYPKVVTSEN